MNARPRIPLQLNTTDRFLNWLALWFLLGLWGMGIFAYTTLPDIIPVHFTIQGKADRSGSKLLLGLIPLISTGLYFLIGALSKRPHLFNYPVAITEQNAAFQYTAATRLLRWVRVTVLLIFFVILVHTWLTAKGYRVPIGPWLFPILLAGPLVPVVVYLVRTLLGAK